MLFRRPQHYFDSTVWMCIRLLQAACVLELNEADNQSINQVKSNIIVWRGLK